MNLQEQAVIKQILSVPQFNECLLLTSIQMDPKFLSALEQAHADMKR